MKQKDEQFFGMFPPVSTEQWETQVEKDLKGADYEKKLVWKTLEGFKVRPYYRSEDLKSIPWMHNRPGNFPFVRGNQPAKNEWLVRQEIKIGDIKTTNEKILDILMKGVDSLGFDMGKEKQYSIDELEHLLKNVRADIAELNFYNTSQPLEWVQMVEELARKYNRELELIKGSVNFDPLSDLMRTGKWQKDEKSDFKTAHQLIGAAQQLPMMRVIGLNGHHFTNAGASIVQEMAFTLSMGSEYLTRLTDMDLLIGQVAPRLKFNLAVGSNYFMEIAKLRAYRLLWAKIVNAYGLFDAMNGRMYIHATNASWNLSLYDPYVNMLRTTTGSMSALLGGTDSFTVLPFNAIFEDATAFSERIARNQQLVIKEESYFNKISDPAGGSYYIENLTKSLVDEAWKLFLQLDESGGFVANLKNGAIQEMINETAARRMLNIATRKEVILGTNQYPNGEERINKALDEKRFQADDQTQPGAEIQGLKTFRGAQAFELMRYKTDTYSRTHQRPKAWMFTFGHLTMRKARAGFASGFFACAGFETIDNPGFETIEQGIEACRAARPEIVVICSSDEAYETHALEIFKALAKEHIVVLAGYPADLVAQLKAAGMEHFIHMRSNVLETLRDFQIKLGIE